MANACTVSVIVPCYNRADFLPVTLASVEQQGLGEALTCVVVDDGSTDESRKAFVETTVDFRGCYRWIERADHSNERGGAECRNVGLKNSDAKFVLFLDSDDVLASNCLTGRLQRLHESSELDFVVGWCERFSDAPGDRSGLVWGTDVDAHAAIESFLSCGSIPWQTSGPLWRKSYLERYNLAWDSSIKRGQDHEFHVRALLNQPRFEILGEVDYFWRQPGQNQAMSGFASLKESHSKGERLLTMVKILDAVSNSNYLGGAGCSRHQSLRELVLRELSSARNFGYTGKTIGSCLQQARHLNLINWLEQRALSLTLCRRGNLARLASLSLLSRIGKSVRW